MDNDVLDAVLAECLPGEVVVWVASQRHGTVHGDDLVAATRLHPRTVEWALRSLDRRGFVDRGEAPPWDVEPLELGDVADG